MFRQAISSVFCFLKHKQPLLLVCISVLSDLGISDLGITRPAFAIIHENRRNSQNEVLLKWLFKDHKPHAIRHLIDSIRLGKDEAGSIRAATSPHYGPYTWVRDSQRVMIAILREMRENHQLSEAEKGRMFGLLQKTVFFQQKLQRTPNLCGAALEGGLGEPKFWSNGTAFNDLWGRPQNDGPALRAIFALEFIKFANTSGTDLHRSFANGLYTPEMPAASFLKADLEYTAKNWSHHSFDYWEEVNAHHLSTRYLQYISLKKGAEYAEHLGDLGAASYYREQARAINESFKELFWDNDKQRFRSHVDRISGHDYKKSKLDVTIFLSLLHGHEDFEIGDSIMRFDSDEMLSTFNQFLDLMDQEYAINKTIIRDENGFPLLSGIGRYNEDRFNGYDQWKEGNPWFLSTQGVAEFLAILGSRFLSKSSQPVTDLNRSFFKRIFAKDPEMLRLLDVDNFAFTTPEMKTRLAEAVYEYSLGFANRARYHTDNVTHEQREQFSRWTGFMTASEFLTWSDESFLSMSRALSILRSQIETARK